MSIFRNSQKLFSVHDADKQHIPIIRGLLFITVTLNILAHTYFMYNQLFFYKYSNILNFLDFMKQFTFVIIANGSNGIENYFFVAGFLLSYARWRLPLQSVELNIWKLLVKPYIRLTLLQLLTIALFLCLPLIGYGPFWGDFVGPYLQNCRERWWVNLFYIQNYWKAGDSCLYHTWVLAVLMQLYVISIPLLWVLIKKPTYGIALIFAVIVVGMAIVGATVFVKQLPGALSVYLIADLESAMKTWNSLYTQTFDHLGAFCIGILTGYVLSKYQPLKLRVRTICICWVASVAALSAVVFSLYEYKTIGVNMNTSVSILYAMLNHHVYSVFLAWFVVACATENAWLIPKLLSFKGLIPFYRLSFVAYMVHLVFMYYHVGILRAIVYLSHQEVVMNFFGYFVASYAISYVLYVFFQAPYYYFEDMFVELYRKIRQTSQRSESVDSSSTANHSLSASEDATTKEMASKTRPKMTLSNMSTQEKTEHQGKV